jgi:hypothetical protein
MSFDCTRADEKTGRNLAKVRPWQSIAAISASRFETLRNRSAISSFVGSERESFPMKGPIKKPDLG